MVGKRSVRSDMKKKNLTQIYKEQKVMESYNRRHPEWKEHIEKDGDEKQMQK